MTVLAQGVSPLKRKARKPASDRNVKPALSAPKPLNRAEARQERLIEREEDRIDIEEAERRLSDPAEVPIPYEQARLRLGLRPLPD